MAERDDDLLRGIDAPRPLPAGLRGRLEESLLAGAALPEDAKDRIASTLTDPAAALLDGVDGPRPLPAALRERLATSLAVVPRGRRVSEVSWLAAAAVALLLAAVGVLLTTPHHRRPDTGRQFAAGQPSADSANGSSVQDGQAAAAPGIPVVPNAGVGRPGFVVAPTTAPRGGGGPTGTAPRRTTDPPPFAFSFSTSFDDAGAAGPGGGPTTTTAPPPPPPPFRVAAITGDDMEQAGFNAYVTRLNDAGGAGGRRFELVAAADHPDAVVNLSGTPFAAGSQPPGPSLDALLSAEAALHGDVFDFAGVPERQGHLIADAVYPTAANATAAIYQEPSGVLGNEVPNAIAAVLKARGVTPVTMTVQPGRPVVAVPADAVFLSLAAADAQAVIGAYAQAPAKGFNGIVTLADEALAPSLPKGVRVLSPYAFPAGAEADALSHDAGRPLSARLVHGWVAAKTRAVAVWQEDPRTPAAVRQALADMAGYSNGFAPAYTFRPGTNSVEPEGVLLVGNGRGFDQQGDFRTDKL
jgi:hypothetical protein